MNISKIYKNNSFSDTERNIIEMLLKNIETSKKIGIRELAASNYTSTTTVVRLAKKLGYQGFTDMYYGLAKHVNDVPSSVGGVVPFVNQFIESLERIPNEYDQILKLAEILHHPPKPIIYICGMGFSKFSADYFTKKLMVQGVKCIFSGAEESIGIFENNLSDIGAFIAVSKSGETEKILERIYKAKEYGLKIAAFTGAPESTLGKISDICISMKDKSKLDDKNLQPSFFFAGVIVKMELVLLELIRMNESSK